MDDYLLKQIIELLKASVPVVALLAMFFTPFMTSFYNKKQRQRDELFSYKVKSCMKIAHAIYSIKIIFVNKYNAAEKGDIINMFSEANEHFLHLVSEEYNSNIIFLDFKMQDRLYDFSNLLLNKIDKCDNLSKSSQPEDLLEKYMDVVVDCDKFLLYLQKQIGVNNIQTN